MDRNPSDNKCGNCQYIEKDIIGDFYCVNDQSEHLADWVIPDDSCTDFEERGKNETFSET